MKKASTSSPAFAQSAFTEPMSRPSGPPRAPGTRAPGGPSRGKASTGTSGAFAIGAASKQPVAAPGAPVASAPAAPATTEELDESMKKLQRVLTGTDDTGQWAAVTDADAALPR